MIEEIVKEREINCLWHFTRLENLENILSEGILPRSILEENNAGINFNDEHRLDRQKDAVCFSIGHPNYKMFYSLRKEHEEIDWVVLACEPEILWIKDCAFCQENAASDNVAKIELQDRKGEDAFERLFEEIEGKPSRDELGISDCCPTNPQAEILVFGEIEPGYIGAIFCKTKQMEDKLKQEFSEWEDKIHELNGLFSARKDYKHWQ